jgi:hypothetical protein
MWHSGGQCETFERVKYSNGDAIGVREKSWWCGGRGMDGPNDREEEVMRDESSGEEQPMEIGA